jgi:RecJ-like exonuclease
MGPSTDYLVQFHAGMRDDQHEAIITLIEGYTTEEDIPRIIALRYGTAAVVVDSIQPHTSPRFS